MRDIVFLRKKGKDINDDESISLGFLVKRAGDVIEFNVKKNMILLLKWKMKREYLPSRVK